MGRERVGEGGSMKRQEGETGHWRGPWYGLPLGSAAVLVLLVLLGRCCGWCCGGNLRVGWG